MLPQVCPPLTAWPSPARACAAAHSPLQAEAERVRVLELERGNRAATRIQAVWRGYAQRMGPKLRARKKKGKKGKKGAKGKGKKK